MNNDIYGITDVVNEEWREDWENVIKTDHNYDGEFLIRLITHKLKLLKDYFSKEDGCKEIVESMNTCYELGIKILTFNYGEEADKIFELYGSPKWFFESSEEDKYQLWDKLSEKASKERDSDIKKLFNLLGDNIVNWWIGWKSI